MLRPSALPLAAALLSACVLTTTPYQADRGPHLPGPAPPSTDTPPGPPFTPHVAYEKIGGDEPARSTPWLARVGQNLARCAPNQNGVLRIRIVQRGDQIAYEIADSVGIDEPGVHCALETLSTVPIDQFGTMTGSPSDRGSGYSALIRIEW